jgi:hypothetical protein
MLQNWKEQNCSEKENSSSWKKSKSGGFAVKTAEILVQNGKIGARQLVAKL